MYMPMYMYTDIHVLYTYNLYTCIIKFYIFYLYKNTKDACIILLYQYI